MDVDVAIILRAVQLALTDIDGDAGGWELDTLMLDSADVEGAVTITIDAGDLPEV